MPKLTLFTFLVIAATTQAAKFPSNWKKCPKYSSEACLKKSVQNAIISLKDGSKDFNLLPIDPLHFSRVEMSQGGSSSVNVNLTFYELDIVGASRIRVDKAKIDWDNYFIEVDATVLNGPGFLLGDYTVNGKVLILPIKGHGKANITLEDLSVLVTLKGHEKIKNGKKYFQADKGIFLIRSPKIHINLENLFDGQPELGKNMNTFLNENSAEVINELNSTISIALGEGIKEVANQFFSKIPVTQLYSE